MQLIDDDSPRVLELADDSRSSPQSRRYWREQGPSGPNQRGSSEARCLPRQRNFESTPCFAMAIVNLRQASAHLGFRTTTTLRRLLQAGELSAYVRSGLIYATYLDVLQRAGQR